MIKPVYLQKISLPYKVYIPRAYPTPNKPCDTAMIAEILSGKIAESKDNIAVKAAASAIPSRALEIYFSMKKAFTLIS